MVKYVTIHHKCVSCLIPNKFYPAPKTFALVILSKPDRWSLRRTRVFLATENLGKSRLMADFFLSWCGHPRTKDGREYSERSKHLQEAMVASREYLIKISFHGIGSKYTKTQVSWCKSSAHFAWDLEN